MMETGIEEDWEMVDYYPPSPFKDEDQEKSQVRWVRMIHAGKKVVIAGLVLTSLPFVLPPLVVISALGLALSVPYGVVLASYACTHKLMTKLLPPPPTPSLTHQDELEGFEDMENEFDEIRREEEEPEGYSNLDDVVAEKDEKPYFNVVKADDMNQGENILQEKSEKEENKENGTSEKQGENFLQEIIITETEKEEKEKDKDKENGTNEIIISETKREEKDEGGESEKEREKIINETKRENGTSENLLQEKITTEAEAKRGEKNEQMKRGSKESGKQRKKKKNGGKRKDGEGEGDPPKLEESASAGEVIALIQQETNQGNIHEKIEVMVQDDSGGVTVNYIESTVIADDGKGADLKEGKDIHSEDQESFSDEKIWEKIDAIREITGLKAPKRDSYYEELKALYLFTGIEAPSTSLDTPPDFVEFYSKLSFLMSVIGLK